MLTIVDPKARLSNKKFNSTNHDYELSLGSQSSKIELVGEDPSIPREIPVNFIPISKVSFISSPQLSCICNSPVF
jgi:hypothetical protein